MHASGLEGHWFSSVMLVRFIPISSVLLDSSPIAWLAVALRILSVSDSVMLVITLALLCNRTQQFIFTDNVKLCFSYIL